MDKYLFNDLRYRELGVTRVQLPRSSGAALERARDRLSRRPDSEEVACPCGAHRDLCVTEVDRNGLPCRLVACERCGLIRMSPRPDAETLAWFYGTVYRDIYGPHEPDRRLLRSKRWKGALVERALRDAAAPLPAGAVVDIGCGGGWTLAPFRSERSCVGYDFDERLLALGRDDGADLRHGGVDQARRDGVQAGLLICGHVLEHVPDPEAHLRSLAPLLADGGLLYVEVPHTRRIGAKLRGDSLLYWQRAHLWDFQRAHVEALVRRAGMEVVWSDEDDASAFVLARRAAAAEDAAARASTPWPARGTEVVESLRGYERRRKSPVRRTLDTLQTFYRRSPRLGGGLLYSSNTR